MHEIKIFLQKKFSGNFLFRGFDNRRPVMLLLSMLLLGKKSTASTGSFSRTTATTSGSTSSSTGFSTYSSTSLFAWNYRDFLWVSKSPHIPTCFKSTTLWLCMCVSSITSISHWSIFTPRRLNNLSLSPRLFISSTSLYWGTNKYWIGGWPNNTKANLINFFKRNNLY